MAHSVELLFDPETEATLCRIWDDLAAAELPSRVPAGRPHVTMAVAERIAPDVDALLRPVAQQLPLDCDVGAPLLFGQSNAVLARLIVPTARASRPARRRAPDLRPAPVARPAAAQRARSVDGARHAGPPHRRRPTGSGAANSGSARGDPRPPGRSAPLGRHRTCRVSDRLTYLPLLPGLAPPPAV